jgi:sugar diacid utilization regulator
MVKINNMKENYRLTVHLEDVKKKSASTGKRVKNSKGKLVDETKSKLFNTLSFYCKSEEDCIKKLNDIRVSKDYKIAKGKNRKKMHKYDKELYNISFVN